MSEIKERIENQDDEISLIDLFAVLLRYKWMIIGITILSCVVAFFTVKFQSGVLEEDKVIKYADDENIKWQHKYAATGGTDGGSIHITGEGIPTAIVALPCRYIHSPVGVASVSDYDAMVRLADAFAKRALEILI